MSKETAQCPQTMPSIHPGEILNEEFLLPMNITQYRLAKAVGVDARRIHAIVHGERSITAETALLLSPLLRKFCGVLDGAAKPVRFGNGLGPPHPQAGHSDALLAKVTRVANTKG